MMTSKDGLAHMEIGQQNTIGVVMEDLPEAERTALEKELQEEMAAARRRKLWCFQKTRTSGNVIHVDANSPYLRSTSMGNLGVFPTASISYPGGRIHFG
jgi:hypothetical protein